MKQNFIIKDSGKRKKYSSGAQRDIQENKGRFDLIPYHAITRVAKHFENGAKKYGDNNYLKGIPLSRYVDSMIRHAFKFKGGEKTEDHLAAVIFNALALIETQALIERNILPKELNDLPSPVILENEKV